MLERTLQWQLLLLQCWLLVLLNAAMTHWSMGLFAGLLAAKAVQLWRQQPAWRAGLVNGCAIIFLLLLAWFGRSLGVMNLMIHLLLLAALLRLLMLPSARRADWQQLLWVHYFLLACAFLLHQAIWPALAVYAAGLVNLRCQYLWVAGKSAPLHWRAALFTTLSCLLVVTLLFVFFPRLAPFWQLPGSNVGQSGLSDEMAPGQIASLLQSDDVAFRVSFDGSPPVADTLYFRAKVYDHFDGVRWQARQSRPADAAAQQMASQLAKAQPDWQYQVIAEPHQQQHLFSLDLSIPASDRSVLREEWLLAQRFALTQRLSYRVAGYARPLPALSNNTRYLQLPAGNPKSRQLALRLKAQLAEPSAPAMVQLISRYLQQQPFRYTLAPGEMDGEQIDAFLFSRQQGFCAHYAQAATFLLRASGFAARVVGGYAGGRWQDDFRYLQVSQADAHAWVEYLHQGHWQRFDPTALIAPDLLTRSQNSAAIQTSAGGQTAVWTLVQLWVLLPLQHLDYYWSAWVLSFDRSAQQQWLQRLQQWRPDLKVWLATLLIALLVFIIVTSYQRWRRPTDAVRLLQPLLQRWPKSSADSVGEYFTQLKQQQPLAAQELQALELMYQRWQFNDEKHLQKAISAQIKRVIRAVKQGS